MKIRPSTEIPLQSVQFPLPLASHLNEHDNRFMRVGVYFVFVEKFSWRGGDKLPPPARPPSPPRELACLSLKNDRMTLLLLLLPGNRWLLRTQPASVPRRSRYSHQASGPVVGRIASVP